MNSLDLHIIQQLSSRNSGQESDALQVLRRQCFAPIIQQICSNNGTVQDAKDIYQDVIINLVEKIRTGNFILTGTLRAYNCEVARRLWLKRLRKTGRISRLKDCTQQFQDESDTLQSILTQEQNKALHLQIDALLGKEKQVLRLFYFEKKKMTEIAQIMNLGSPQVAKNLKCKAMKKLKDKFRQ